MSAAHLQLESYWTLLFNDRTYRWFDSKQYRICGEGSSDDRDLLRSLIHQPSYGVAVPGPNRTQSGIVRDQPQSRIKEFLERERIHGPYWLRCITADRFDAVDAATAKDRLMAWGRDFDDGLPPKGLLEVERLGQLAQAATGLFWLQPLEEECVRTPRFLAAWAELVIIDRNRAEVLLVVGSGD